jgi:phosphatidate phosphatase PAH1
MGRLVALLAPIVLLASLLGACGGKDSHGDLPPADVECSTLAPAPAVVTDIDGTLTLSDAEFLQEFVDATYVPVAWPDAVTLIRELYDRGYLILYLTARPETLAMSSGKSVRDATVDWLKGQGFPLDSKRTEVVLAPDSTSGAATTAYKLGVLQERQAAGWRLDLAYGNATTDIDAYLQAGIPPEDVFIIGENSGEQGTAPVAGDGWTDHLATVVAPTPRVCDF